MHCVTIVTTFINSHRLYKMSKFSFSAELINSGEAVKAGLEIYKFKENDMYVIYCPSLDLSAYGRTEEEVESEFGEVFRIHITYCLNNNTLADDLRSHGWNFKSLKQKTIKAPTIQEMLQKNELLRDIIYNKDYVKQSECVQIPQMA